MSAESAFRTTVCGLLIFGGLAFAEVAETPDLDFLEYLGMWEESDEDWQLIEETMTADVDERSDPVPEREESAEKEDES